MGMIDRITAAGQQATSRARESIEETQIRRDLGHAYTDLGHSAYALIATGALSDPRLTLLAELIEELESRLAALTRRQASGMSDERQASAPEQTSEGLRP